MLQRFTLVLNTLVDQELIMHNFPKIAAELKFFKLLSMIIAGTEARNISASVFLCLKERYSD